MIPVSLITRAFAVLAAREISTLVVALAAVFVVVYEIDALGPAPGQTFSTVGIIVAARCDDQ